MDRRENTMLEMATAVGCLATLSALIVLTSCFRVVAFAFKGCREHLN